MNVFCANPELCPSLCILLIRMENEDTHCFTCNVFYRPEIGRQEKNNDNKVCYKAVTKQAAQQIRNDRQTSKHYMKEDCHRMSGKKKTVQIVDVNKRLNNNT